uniref:Uncharacterized protein n=1 Tax=Amorphochlora amoebiformis TaxID=1561963 RepID=A0A7S0DDB0_9EUKA
MWKSDYAQAENLRSNLRGVEGDVTSNISSAVEAMNQIRELYESMKELECEEMKAFLDAKKKRSTVNLINKKKDELLSEKKEISKLCDDLDNHNYLEGESRFQTHSRSYLRIDEDRYVDARATDTKDKQAIFKVSIERRNPVRLGLKAANGRYVKAQRRGGVLGLGIGGRAAFELTSECQGWETYTLFFRNAASICLKTEHKTWMSADQEGNLTQVKNCDTWETFRCVDFKLRRAALIETIEKKIQKFRNAGSKDSDEKITFGKQASISKWDT